MAKETANKYVPDFIRTSLKNLHKGIDAGLVKSPSIAFLTDKLCFAYYDIDKNLYLINLDRIEKLEEQMQGMVDPESGEPVSIPEYVEQNLAPVQNQVIYMNTEIEEIRNNGAAIMLTLKDLTDSGGGDNG